MMSTQPLARDEGNQAVSETLERGGRVLKLLGLGQCLLRPVPKPKKGEVLQQIKLQVPFTKQFVAQQKKEKALPRRTNRIITSKYNLYTFLPLASAYQFRRFTNAFYLVILVIALIGYYGSVDGKSFWIVSFNPVTIIILLVIVVGVALIFEGKDDFNRHFGDAKTNNTKVSRIRNCEVEETTWGDLLPGDFVFVNDRESVPADIVFLFSYGADKKGSMCYIETSGIDGETNLKIKEVPQFMTSSTMQNDQVKSWVGDFRKTKGLTRVASSHSNRKADIAKFIPTVASGEYEYEQPNVFLQFNGSFKPRSWEEEEKFPLDFKNLILRGSQLRNTKWIVGVVVYAGPETKLALSRQEVPAKFSRIDRFVNKILAIVFVLFLGLCSLADILLFQVGTDTEKWWYFQYTSSESVFAVPGPLAYYFTYVVLFANIIPIPCVIVIEVMNFYAQYMLANDIEMYDEETDTPAACRTGNLAADIGQITHIFSDKTGTLTRNQMKMVGCFVDSTMYGYIPPKVNDDYLTDSLEVSSVPLSQQEGEEGTNDLLELDEESLFSQEEDDDADDNAQCTLTRKGSTKSIQLEEVFSDVIEILKSTEESKERTALFDFFVLLGVCHTVVLDWDDEGNTILNAESPDEEAFVKAAKVVGVELVSTSDGRIEVNTPHGLLEYRILALNPFNSTRKRMSMVLNRVNDGSIVLLMKGADSTMLERLAEGQNELVKPLNNALTQYSWNGLRTLVMGSRDISEEEFLEWETTFKAAMVAPGATRGKELSACAEKIEKNVKLLGASSIEDQLQDGVPDAIKTLREAGIQVWVLTGDKIETAINIGLSSNLLDSQMLQIKLVSEDVGELERDLDEIISVLDNAMIDIDDPRKLNEETGLAEEEAEDTPKTVTPRYSLDQLAPLEEGIKQARKHKEKKLGCIDHWFSWWYKLVLQRQMNQDIQVNAALVVSGVALELLLAKQKGSPELEAKFLKVARISKVVMACRVSPAQKSLLVESVRYAPDVGIRTKPPITLAIGDGSNDVPMLQKSHVGVGISGHEGRQAVNSSDFSFAGFKSLVRLLLVHGRWNYRRQANVIVYVTYSWLLYTFLLFIYLPYSLYSGQQIFYLTIYTAVFAYFANVPIVASGFFDKDISARMAIRHPWTYGVGVKSDDLNYKKLATLTLRAATHTVLIWGLVFQIVPIWIPIDTFGAYMFLAIVIVLFIQQLLRTTTFTSLWVLVFVVMLVAFLIFMAASSTPTVVYDDNSAPTIWTGVLLTVSTVIAIEMVVRYVKKEFLPRPLDLLIELDRGYFRGEKHTRSSYKDAIKVLGEFGKITILPFTFGAKQIKNSLDKKDQQQLQPADDTFAGPARSQLLDLAATPFTKLKPAFDYSAIGVRKSVSETMRRFRARSFSNSSLTGGTSRRESSSSSAAADHDDSVIFSMSSSRLEFSNYIKKADSEDTTVLSTIREDSKDRD